MPPAKSIVVVEDDASLLSAILFALQTDGYDAQGFGDARDMIERGPAQADCLVIDFRLPTMDGLSLVAELRRRNMAAPAILITTDPDERCRNAAAAAGVSIVEKPLIDGELVRRIETLVAG